MASANAGQVLSVLDDQTKRSAAINEQGRLSRIKASEINLLFVARVGRGGPTHRMRLSPYLWGGG